MRNLIEKMGFDKQLDQPEDQRKGVIFSYFIGAIWIISVINTLQNLYLSFTLEGTIGQEYAGYNASNIGFVIFLGLIWWGHRWYPRLMRHIFILLLVLGVIFFFQLSDVNQLFVALTLPIIMAAFLIRPIYSFVYYFSIVGIYVFRLYLEGIAITDENLFPFLAFIALVVIAVVSWLIAQSLDKALAETRALNRELDQRVQDRTHQLAEALARESATAVRNTTILESIADGVLFFDANQRVMIANPAANQLAQQDLHISTLADILITIEEKARETIKTWVMGHKPTDQNNVKFEWHDRIISATIAPVILPTTNGKQADAGNVMVLRDFTREAELERAKSLFLGMVSHELRTPMSAIKGYVKVLLNTEKNSLSETGYEYLETIDGSIKQLLTLANELIDLARMESGEFELYREWIDLTTIMNQSLKIVQQEFMARNLALDVKLANNLPQLYLDRNRIMQVFLNLLSNAYKYTAQGGASVEISQSDEWVRIRVKDSGIGIKPADQAHMFSRFFRADDQFVRKAGGTGLGLSITKNLIELHGGQLTFISQYGRGTTFEVALPKNGPAQDEADPALQP
jgi:signal transduction histidine kinase